MHAFIFYILVLSSISSASLAEATKNLKGFSIDLIHRDSPLSPFYDPSLTTSQLIKNAALRSIARSNRINSLVNENKLPKTITIPDPDLQEYLVIFYIGTPPVERFAIADTGSDLIWVQCTPCKQCVPQDTPLFDPKKSSTFKSVSCDSQPCTLLPKSLRFCGKSGECIYAYIYGDKTVTVGSLGLDFINFGIEGGNNTITFPKFTFGCGYGNNDTGVKAFTKNTGIVGLGAGPLSLVSQLGDEIGHKFSYCLLPLASNSTSKLKFGNEAMIKGKSVVSTPLIIKSSIPTLYYLNLEGISVGKKMVKTSKSQTDGNMVIDSGTRFTILEQRSYNKFITLVKEVLGVEAEQNPPDEFDFCFKHNDSNVDFPNIVFHFTGAKVHLNWRNIFTVFGDNLICMWVSPGSEESEPLQILGNGAQVGFQVEYDLKEEKAQKRRVRIEHLESADVENVSKWNNTRLKQIIVDIAVVHSVLILKHCVRSSFQVELRLVYLH
ncbi:aspartic proteinase CDR1-like [Abrus precatorius]|uniref:Aspartic proteinase CDR1-like n=1 Tax=Abrus precatorius TaxID=3816 RepID=A0A8B8KGR2_ABRPR|nr:aspartic proteinase CDR1-like [Abrus precatorius]